MSRRCEGRGARVCRAVKRRQAKGPGRAGVSRRRAPSNKAETPEGRGVRVCRAVKLRGNFIGRGRAGVARV